MAAERGLLPWLVLLAAAAAGGADAGGLCDEPHQVKLTVHLCCGHVPDKDGWFGDTSDAYAHIIVDDVMKTSSIEWNKNNPAWDEDLHFGCVNRSQPMVVIVADHDTFTADDMLLEASWRHWNSFPFGQTKRLHRDNNDNSQFYVDLSLLDPTSGTPLPTAVPVPVPDPTAAPTHVPTPVPTSQPSHAPTPHPMPHPTPVPVPAPTPQPSRVPTPQPSHVPTPQPSAQPTPQPSAQPTPSPTKIPTGATAGAVWVAPVVTSLVLVVVLAAIVGWWWFQLDLEARGCPNPWRWCGAGTRKGAGAGARGARYRFTPSNDADNPDDEQLTTGDRRAAGRVRQAVQLLAEMASGPFSRGHDRNGAGRGGGDDPSTAYIQLDDQVTDEIL